MRLVDVNTVKSRVPVYNIIPQPMIVYHSLEELQQNEKEYLVADSFDSLLVLFRLHNIDLNYTNLPADAKYRDLQHLNLFIKTVDKFIPDYADLVGNIYYVVNENGFIPTDACYTKCHYFLPTSSKFILFCSNGVNTVKLTKWQPTAAVRSQFLYEKDDRKAGGGEKVYAEKILRLSNRTRPNVDLYKFLFAFLHRDAPSFMNIHKSAALAYGTKVRAADREKILSSPAFRRAMIQILKILEPQLKAKILLTFPPEKMAELLLQAANTAKESKNVKDILLVFDKIEQVGYEVQQTINNTTFPEVPLIGEIKQPALTESEKQDLNTFYDEIREETDSLPSFVTLDPELDEETAT